MSSTATIFFIHYDTTHTFPIMFFKLLIDHPPLLKHSCWILAGIAPHCVTEHIKYAQCDINGVSVGNTKTGMFSSTKNLCADPYNMGLCFIMLHHKVM